MTRLVRAALVAVVACCAGAAAAQAPTYLGLRFPDTVAGFPRGESTDFERDHPGAGYRVRYNAEPWAISVFIYDDGVKNIPDQLTSDIVTAQFAKARGGIYKRAEQVKGSAEERERFEIHGPDGKPRYICGTYFVVDNSLRIDHTLCLTTWHGKFIRYRLGTLARDGSLATAKRFVAAWTAILWP
jgi:hypothetical protein